tara:strand:+ start:362 stop:2392 length:2031 start_codon:yes stop_codon:yes gene_type:complete
VLGPFDGAWRREWAQSLADIWVAESRRKPLWLAAAFGAGVALYFLLRDEPPALTALAVAGPALVLMAMARRTALRAAALLVLMAAAGFAAGQVRVATVEAPRLTKPTPRFESEVCIERVTLRTSSTELIVARWSAGAPVPEQLRARFRWRNPPEGLSPGERLSVQARLFPVSGAIYPNSYDPRRIAYFDGVGAEGWLGKTTARAGRCWQAGPLADARTWLRARLLELVPNEAGGILVGVTTGWRGDIAREDAEAMRNAGLGHLLAISGLHVGLVVGLILVSLRAGLALIPYIALRYPIQKWAAVAGLIAGIGYLLFSGGSVPTQRAMIMLGLVLIALILDRIELSMRPVAWAAVIVLAAAPESILSPSFQLSFAAVIGLVAVFETWRRRKRLRGAIGSKWPWAARYVTGVAATTVIATFATMPFAAFHFHRIALLGVFANLIAVPVFAFWVMPALLIGLMLAPFGLEGPAWQAAGYGVDVILGVAYSLGMAEGAVASVGPVPFWGIGCAVLGGLWWAIWQERWRWLGVPVALIGVLAPLTAQPPDIVVAQDLLAVSNRDGAYWMRGRGGFVREQWLRETGGTALAWPTGPAQGAAGVELACDYQACRFTSPDGSIALVEDPLVAGDCQLADYGISRFKVPECDWWAGFDETVLLTLRDGVVERTSSRWPPRPWIAR